MLVLANGTTQWSNERAPCLASKVGSTTRSLFASRAIAMTLYRLPAKNPMNAIHTRGPLTNWYMLTPSLNP